jgi:hypothetical protein
MHVLLSRLPIRSDLGHRHLRRPQLQGIIATSIAFWCTLGCAGEIGLPNAQSIDPSGQPVALGVAGGSGASISAAAGQTTPGVTAPTCTTPSAAPAPLARLTDLEYRNSVATLFPGMTLPPVELPDDIVVEGFDNNAKAQNPSPSLIEQYRANAEAIASAVTANPSALVPCSGSDQDACGKQFVDNFVPRAFRRPITADERTRFDALFSGAKTSWGYPTALGIVIRASLQSPNFLYRVELGGPAANGVASLNGYEMASRLSYFLWDSPPDDTLAAAAASGGLDLPSGIETQARRLLADARAHAAIANLFKQWLRFDKMQSMAKSASQFPNWSDALAQSLRDSTTMFVERAFWQQKSLRSLLTDNSAFIDANIASIYGLPAPSGPGLQLVAADKTRRSGILTQAGLMAAFAHETADSPVLRGVFVMDRLLCSAPPPPPPGVTGSIEGEISNVPMTTRDRFAMTHETGTCASCHHFIDGYGFGFEHYDAIGQWRDTDNGLPVDATGWIVGTNDGSDGAYDGAVDLGQRLANSTQVRDCVASQWFRFSLGLGAADVDTCDLAPIGQAFADSGGDLQALVIATVKSDAFRRRPEIQL